MKLRVLFLCATNGLHSPMAEALLGRMDSQHFEAVSAGTSCGRLHPFTVEVMKEIGIDLAGNTPKPIQELTDNEFDYVITLGESSGFHRLTVRSAEIVHWKFDDLIAGPNDPEKQLRAFRIVRDQIAQRLRLFVIVHVRQRTPGPGTTFSKAARAR